MSIPFLMDVHSGDLNLLLTHNSNSNNQNLHNQVCKDMEDVGSELAELHEPMPDKHSNIVDSKNSGPVVEVSLSLTSC
jgi:hypothetical protein